MGDLKLREYIKSSYFTMECSDYIYIYIYIYVCVEMSNTITI